MLPLLERVVGHLERVRRVAEKDVVDRNVAPDYDRFEAFVLGSFDRRGGNDGGSRDIDPAWRLDPSYVRAFVDAMHWIVLDGIGARWPALERFELIEAGLSWVSTLEACRNVPHFSPSRARLLAALAESTEDSIGHPSELWPDKEPWNVAARYCTHLGLTLGSSSGASVSPAGSLLVRLRGRDRLRWLLALETSLATSDRDSWCTDLKSVRALALERTLYTRLDGLYVSDSTLARWTELGAIAHELEDTSKVNLTLIGREIFGELARNEVTSFRTLVRALLEDDRERMLAPQTNTEPSPDRATAATLRHARLVAHEVRNTLGPIQYALKKVWASPAMTATELSEPRQWIDEGFERLHRFIDDSLRLVPSSADETTTFSVMDVIDEARRQCVPGPERGIQIATLPASADPRCRGHRGRLVVALLNLLRNAVQAGATTIRVSVDARKPRSVTIRVHDDGPGIPTTRWDTLFANGVSHRDGGSGHGLSFVRLVIEQEMRGRVQPVPPPDGVGACFELELTTEEEAK